MSATNHGPMIDLRKDKSYSLTNATDYMYVLDGKMMVDDGRMMIRYQLSGCSTTVVDARIRRCKPMMLMLLM